VFSAVLSTAAGNICTFLLVCITVPFFPSLFLLVLHRLPASGISGNFPGYLWYWEWGTYIKLLWDIATDLAPEAHQ